ncbi:MAG TPA: GNAT family N-acetyltransferase [Streptosporangiaceae bacterium]|nr:GNAT family N-acetyltransferase [Streptosporangiaceae bacterium]
MRSDHVRIRPYQPADLDDLYRICLLTADNGQDGTRLFRDPRLVGDVYLAPYVTFEPSLAFVAQDAEGVAGYIVAALDSRAFEQRLNDDWWPKLRARYPEPPPHDGETWSGPERIALTDIHHHWPTADELASRFPSHMHIDLLPRLQGRGLGRKLIETLVTALRDHGSPGLHLLVGDGNQKAVGFYRHVGFAEIPAEKLYPVTGLRVFVMDLRA